MAKGPDAFRTISEAADEVGVPQHVLRFWETKFSFVKPMKRAGGRRFYRPSDLTLLKGIRALLHEDGYTIRGVQQLHRDSGAARIVAAGTRAPGKAGRIASAAVNGEDAPEVPAAAAQPPAPIAAAGGHDLGDLLADLQAAKARLDAALRGG